MNFKNVCLLGCAGLLSASLFVTTGHASTRRAPGKYAPVGAIVRAKCVSCHNAKRHPENVDLSSYTQLMKSGEHGPIVVPDHPETSKFLLYVDGTKQPRMPFGKPPLSKSEIGTIRHWIASGAKP